MLGDSDFVENVLKTAQEELEQKNDLKNKGYDLDRVAQRVAELMSLEIEQVTAFGKSPQTVKARSLLCFWLHRKVGMTTVEIGKKVILIPQSGRPHEAPSKDADNPSGFNLPLGDAPSIAEAGE